MIEELIKNRIKEAREKLKLKQKEFAEKLGVHINIVSKWERGLVFPRKDKLEEIAKLINEDISWFYIDENLPESEQPTKQLQEQILSAIKLSNEELNKKFDILLNKITLSGLTKEIGEKNNVIQFPNTRNNSNSRKMTSYYTIPYFEEQKVGAGEVFASGMHYEEQAAGMISVESYGRPDVALRVLGESMEPDIPNGSIVLVRLTALQSPLGWKSGDILLLYRTDTETLLVRQVVVGSSSRIKLVSPKMEAEYITMSDVIIRGVVEDIIKPNQVKEILERIEPIEG